MNKAIILSQLLISFFLLAILSACGSPSSDASSENTQSGMPVILNLVMQPEITVPLKTLNAVSPIASITVTVRGDGKELASKTVLPTPGELLTIELKVLSGKNRTFSIIGKDEGGRVVLEGQATVNIDKNQKAPQVISIGLKPAQAGGGGQSPNPAQTLSSGEAYSCALRQGGQVECWGKNEFGQLGNGTRTDSSIPVLVNGITGATAVAAGSGHHSCALLTDGTIQCWGGNSSGELGNGTRTDSLTPVPVSGITNATAVSTGTSHSCALLTDGRINCWGQGVFNQLGNGEATNSSTPVPVSGITSARALSVGAAHSCALLADNTINCWGTNGTAGRLGNGTTTESSIPVLVSEITSATAVSAGGFGSCALLADGSIKCWGANFFGQLGNETTTASSIPVLVSGITSARAVSAGNSHNCALLLDGRINCWGRNFHGQLGNGTVANSLFPVLVSGITNAVLISGGVVHSCALLADGSIKCWGDNFFGQLGDGTTTDSTTPVQVIRLTPPQKLSAGLNHSCAVRPDGGVDCWGSNVFGQLGNGTVTPALTLVPVSGITSATAVSVGSGHHSCALLADGTIQCWGENVDGELGDGTTTDSLTPVPVSGITNATAISAGRDHSCALLTDGRINCWGSGVFSQLGNGKVTNSPFPVLVSEITNATAVSSGGRHSCALLADGSIKCWGNNVRGGLGNGTTTDSSIPVLVSEITSATAVSAGEFNGSCALLADGSIKCWGRNLNGELGNGTTLTPSSIPVLVSGITSARAVSAGALHRCAVLSDGRINCWGKNRRGQLGNGRTTDSSIPVLASEITSTEAVSAGGSHSCALLADGSIKCWGDNFRGQLGDGTTTNALIPVGVIGIP